jgi:hypothetical protein
MVKEASAVLPTIKFVGVTEPVATRSMVGGTGMQSTVMVEEVTAAGDAQVALEVSLANTCVPLVALFSV